MNKAIITEERLIKLIQRVIKEQEETTDVAST